MADDRALVVARRAAALAAARGVGLADDLTLWVLAGGRPVVDPQPGEPEELGELLEQATGRSTRRRLGVHFTPRQLARDLVDRALDGHDRPSVGDPACGGGAILLAAAHHLAERGEDPRDVVQRLWARDVDPLAVATTEATLALWAGVAPAPGRCSVGDALLDDLGWPDLDVVAGNPPFLSPLSESTSRSAEVSAQLRERFGDAVGAYTDTAGLFLLAACRLARAGGTVSLIQPRSVLTNRDAVGVRTGVEHLAAVRDVWMSTPGSFDAAVDVCIVVLDVDGNGTSPSRRVATGPSSWARHLSHSLGVPTVELTGDAVLGDTAEVVAAFRTEYYGTVPHVHEQDDCPSGRPLLTSGMIDLGGVAWGERPARVGKRAWDHPVVDVGALEGRAAQWIDRTAGPKLVVATQTRVLELIVDEDGRYVAGVPLVVVRPDPARLWQTAAALASPAVSAWLFHRSAGSGLSRDALRISAPSLRAVPLPRDRDAWDAGAQAFRARDLDGFVGAMATAYGVGPEIGAWWVERARSVWSPAGAAR